MRWNMKQYKYLRENWTTATQKEIMAEIPATWLAISQRAAQLKLERRMCYLTRKPRKATTPITKPY